MIICSEKVTNHGATTKYTSSPVNVTVTADTFLSALEEIKLVLSYSGDEDDKYYFLRENGSFTFNSEEDDGSVSDYECRAYTVSDYTPEDILYINQPKRG
jgi:hypothetical protein